MSDLVLLADAVLCSGWFNRAQGWGGSSHDRSWCSLCEFEGGYHDYSLDWHAAGCPIRTACKVLGRTDPLGYAVMSKGWRKRVMDKATA